MVFDDKFIKAISRAWGIMERTPALKHFFVVCDEDGIEAKRCARFLLASLIIKLFEGEDITDVEKNFIELVATACKLSYRFETEGYDATSSILTWSGKNQVLLVRISKREKFFGDKEILRPLMLVFRNEITGVSFIYPRLSKEIVEEISGELVAKLC